MRDYMIGPYESSLSALMLAMIKVEFLLEVT